MKQLGLPLKTWGGKRKGAGRKPNGARAGVSHLRRAALAARHPVHVTLRVLDGVGYLRAALRVRLIEQVFASCKERLGLRLVHFSIQGAHLHLIIEAQDSRALARGMQGLCIRLARRLNSLAGRRGKVFADRYHAHVLRTRAETAHAVRYVARNYVHHARENLPLSFVDPCSSMGWRERLPPEDAPVVAPHTWLLRSLSSSSGGALNKPQV
jgi:REP element-mobilizing transposase RayT